jgi:hypothetical protein
MAKLNKNGFEMDRDDGMGGDDPRFSKIDSYIFGGFVLVGIGMLAASLTLPFFYREPPARTLPVEVRRYDVNNNGTLEPTEIEALLRDYSPKPSESTRTHENI